jgi:hypothetical protein
MQTRTYGELFKLIQSLSGVRAFAPSEQDDIANLINRRFSEIYNESPIWPRYVVPNEPRSGTINQVVPYTQDAVIVEGAGTEKANGFYTRGMTRDSGSTYTKDLSSIRFTISGVTSDTNINGEYQFYASTDNAGPNGTEEDGSWVKVDDPRYEITRLLYSNWAGPSGQFWRLSVPGGSPSAIEAPNKTNYPWLATWSEGTFSGPDETYHFLNGVTENKLDLPDVSPGAAEKSFPLYSGTPSGSGTQLVVQGGKLPAPFANTTQEIGDFIRIHRTQPFLNNSALEYDFYVAADGAHVMNVVSSTEGAYYVTYKTPFVPFNVTGDYVNSTVEVPLEFFHYLAHGTYADFLRMDGQTDKAFAEEQKAGTYMALELERIDTRSNNNSLNQRFSTYVNKQAR